MGRQAGRKNDPQTCCALSLSVIVKLHAKKRLITASYLRDKFNCTNNISVLQVKQSTGVKIAPYSGPGLLLNMRPHVHRGGGGVTVEKQKDQRTGAIRILSSLADEMKVQWT